MTENDSVASAPKKLKLTLKLNSSSSSPSSTPVTSQLTSSIPASPVKAINSTTGHVVPLSDLPSGLGNLKGRGRPKKAAASKITEKFTKEANSNSYQPSNPAASTPNEYALDLKSFVSSMNTFKSRSWSLHRPLVLESKNVAGYSVNLTSGLWCTFTGELGSAHLRSSIIDTAISMISAAATVDSNDSVAFEVTCKCGKVFNNQSKYKKHLKIHEKPANDPLIPAPPTISLKIKLNTTGNNSSSSSSSSNSNNNNNQ